MILHRTLYALLIWSSSTLRADALDDLLRMSALYQQHKELYLEFDVLLNYQNVSKTQEKHSCIVTLDATHSYYKALSTEYVMDHKQAVFIDHSQKLLVVGSGLDEASTSLMNAARPFKDTAQITRNYKVNYAAAGTGVIEIKPKDENSEFAMMHIRLNSDYTLQKITYYYKKEVNSKHITLTSYEIIYRKQAFKARPGFFSSGRFVSVSPDDKIIPARTMTHYKLVDKRIKYKH